MKMNDFIFKEDKIKVKIPSLNSFNSVGNWIVISDFAWGEGGGARLQTYTFHVHLCTICIWLYIWNHLYKHKYIFLYIHEDIYLNIELKLATMITVNDCQISSSFYVNYVSDLKMSKCCMLVKIIVRLHWMKLVQQKVYAWWKEYFIRFLAEHS